MSKVTTFNSGLINGLIGFPTLLFLAGILVGHFRSAIDSESPTYMFLFLGLSVWNIFIFWEIYFFKLKLFKKLNLVLKKDKFILNYGKKADILAYIMINNLFPLLSKDEAELEKFTEGLRGL